MEFSNNSTPKANDNIPVGNINQSPLMKSRFAKIIDFITKQQKVRLTHQQKNDLENFLREASNSNVIRREKERRDCRRDKINPEMFSTLNPFDGLNNAIAEEANIFNRNAAETLDRINTSTEHVNGAVDSIAGVFNRFGDSTAQINGAATAITGTFDRLSAMLDNFTFRANAAAATVSAAIRAPFEMLMKIVGSIVRGTEDWLGYVASFFNTIAAHKSLIFIFAVVIAAIAHHYRPRFLNAFFSIVQIIPGFSVIIERVKDFFMHNSISPEADTGLFDYLFSLYESFGFPVKKTLAFAASFYAALKLLLNVQKVASGISKLFDFFVSWLITDNIYARDAISSSCLIRDTQDWMEKAAVMLCEGATFKVNTDKCLARDVVSLATEAFKLEKRFAAQKSNDLKSAQLAFNAVFTPFKLILDAGTKCLNREGDRMVPLCFAILGDPGVGKTRFGKYMGIDLMNHFRRGKKHGPEDIYVDNTNDPFSSGYHGQAIWFSDDMFRSKDLLNLTQENRDFISSVNDTTYRLNMARLEEKGSTLDQSLVHIITTNAGCSEDGHKFMPFSKLGVCPTSQSPHAIDRRVHFSIRPKPRPEFCYPPVGKKAPVVNSELVAAALREGKIEHPMQISVYDYFHWSTPDKIETATYEELRSKLLDELLAHERDFLLTVGNVPKSIQPDLGIDTPPDLVGLFGETMLFHPNMKIVKHNLIIAGKDHCLYTQAIHDRLLNIYKERVENPNFAFGDAMRLAQVGRVEYLIGWFRDRIGAMKGVVPEKILRLFKEPREIANRYLFGLDFRFGSAARIGIDEEDRVRVRIGDPMIQMENDDDEMEWLVGPAAAAPNVARVMPNVRHVEQRELVRMIENGTIRRFVRDTNESRVDRALRFVQDNEIVFSWLATLSCIGILMSSIVGCAAYLENKENKRLSEEWEKQRAHEKELALLLREGKDLVGEVNGKIEERGYHADLKHRDRDARVRQTKQHHRNIVPVGESAEFFSGQSVTPFNDAIYDNLVSVQMGTNTFVALYVTGVGNDAVFLTAAHCLKGMRTHETIGFYPLDVENGVIVRSEDAVARAIVHSDIAIIRVADYHGKYKAKHQKNLMSRFLPPDLFTTNNLSRGKYERLSIAPRRAGQRVFCSNALDFHELRASQMAIREDDVDVMMENDIVLYGRMSTCNGFSGSPVVGVIDGRSFIVGIHSYSHGDTATTVEIRFVGQTVLHRGLIERLIENVQGNSDSDDEMWIEEANVFTDSDHVLRCREVVDELEECVKVYNEYGTRKHECGGLQELVDICRSQYCHPLATKSLAGWWKEGLEVPTARVDVLIPTRGRGYDDRVHIVHLKNAARRGDVLLVRVETESKIVDFVVKDVYASHCQFYRTTKGLQEWFNARERGDVGEINQHAEENLHKFLEEATVQSPGIVPLCSTIDVEHEIRQNPNTKLQRTLLYGFIAEPIRHPALLSEKNIIREGYEGGDPHIASAALGGKTFIGFDSRVWDMAKTFVRNDVLRCGPRGAFQRPNFHAGIFGRKSSRYYRALEWNTSSGYPYNTKGFAARKVIKGEFGPRKKNIIFGEAEFLEGETPICQPFIDEFQRFIYLSRNNPDQLIVLYPVSDVLKDELRPDKKRAKPRIFNPVPLMVNVVIRVLYGDFFEFVMQNAGACVSAVGVNPLSRRDWGKIFNQFSDFGNNENFIAGDFSKWDRQLSSDVIEDVLDLWDEHIDLCGYRYPLETDDFGEHDLSDDDIAALRIGIRHWFRHHLHISKGFVYSFGRGNPSGNAATTMLNTFANALITTAAYIECKEENLGGWIQQSEINLKGIYYGDDHVVSAPEFESFFNQLSLADVMARHNVNYTDARKGLSEGETPEFVPLDGVQFLKRGFVPVTPTNYLRGFHGALPKEQIEDMINYSNCDPLDSSQMTQLAETMIREALMHDREYARQLRERLVLGFTICGRKVGKVVEYCEVRIASLEDLEKDAASIANRPDAMLDFC